MDVQFLRMCYIGKYVMKSYIAIYAHIVIYPLIYLCICAYIDNCCIKIFTIIS